MRDSTPLIKVAFVGERLSGKSSLIHRCCHGTFQPRPDHRNGIVISNAKLLDARSGGGGGNLEAQLWEYSGASDKTGLDRLFDGALAIVITFDITSNESFRAATTTWLNTSRSQCPNAFYMLLGCKTDRVSERSVEIKRAEEVASREKLFFMETSAKDGTNVDLSLTILRIRVGHVITTRRNISSMSYRKPSKFVVDDDDSKGGPLDVREKGVKIFSPSQAINKNGLTPSSNGGILARDVGDKSDDLQQLVTTTAANESVNTPTLRPMTSADLSRSYSTINAILGRYPETEGNGIATSTSPLGFSGTSNVSNTRSSYTGAAIENGTQYEVSEEYAKLKRLLLGKEGAEEQQRTSPQSNQQGETFSTSHRHRQDDRHGQQSEATAKTRSSEKNETRLKPFLAGGRRKSYFGSMLAPTEEYHSVYHVRNKKADESGFESGMDKDGASEIPMPRQGPNTLSKIKEFAEKVTRRRSSVQRPAWGTGGGVPNYPYRINRPKAKKSNDSSRAPSPVPILPVRTETGTYIMSSPPDLPAQRHRDRGEEESLTEGETVPNLLPSFSLLGGGDRAVSTGAHKQEGGRGRQEDRRPPRHDRVAINRQRAIQRHIARNRQSVTVVNTSHPRLSLEVALNDGRTETVKIGMGENPRTVARVFGARYHMPKRQVAELATMLRNHLAQFAEKVGSALQVTSTRPRTSRSSLILSDISPSNSIASTRSHAQRMNVPAPTVPRPFRFSTDSRLKHRRREGEKKTRVIARMNVAVVPNRTVPLVVREGENPREVVGAFGATYGLRPNATNKILQMLRSQIKNQALDSNLTAAPEIKLYGLGASNINHSISHRGRAPVLGTRKDPSTRTRGSSGSHRDKPREDDDDDDGRQRYGEDQENTMKSHSSSPNRAISFEPPAGLNEEQLALWERTLGISTTSVPRQMAKESQQDGEDNMQLRPADQLHANDEAKLEEKESRGRVQGSRSAFTSQLQKAPGTTTNLPPPPRYPPPLSSSSSSLKSPIFAPRAGEAPTTSSFPPSPSSTSVKGGNKTKALFNLDVNIGNGVTGRIVVHHEDNPSTLAKDFVTKYSLPQTALTRLTALISETKVNASR